MTISYVVLHYMTTQDTVECIEAILHNIKSNDLYETRIVVVDNGSPNNSYDELYDAYKNNENVKLIRSNENLGFAKGNNLGFQYSKYQLKADFIILCNNDTIISQKDFSDVIIRKYEDKKFDILGPDIVTADGFPQNPGKDVDWTFHKLRRFRLKKFVQFLMSFFACFDKYLKMNDEAFLTEKLSEDQLNVHLHGACLIFSPGYIQRFEGLYDKTFLYMEEDILRLRADYYGYLMMYTPELTIFHKEDRAMRAAMPKSILQKRLFYKNLLYSSKIYKKLKKEYSAGRFLRRIIEKTAQKFKGAEYKLDNEIPISYLVGIGLRRAIMLFRGFVKQGFRKHYKIFCGKKVILKNRGKITFHDGVTLQDYVYIDALSSEGVYIGKGSSIGCGSVIRCTGNLKVLGKGFYMGNNSSMADNCFIGATGGVWIGDDVIMGQNVRFHSSNHNFKDRSILIRKQGITAKGIRIGNNCWIGAGSVFCDGITIGDGCVVGTNSVLTKNFPDNCIIAGVPAKIIGTRGC